jgi:hypothetical protein
MHDQGNSLWRWLQWHRLHIATAAALVGLVVVSLTASPALLVGAMFEWKYSRRRTRLLSLAVAGLLVRAVVWLWQEFRGLPHGRWHPCAQCGAPIESPSRAWYCSPACRRYARLERDARSPDPWLAERSAAQLRTVSRIAAPDPELSKIPF